MTNAEKFARLNGIESIKDGEVYYPDFEDAKSILEVMMKREDWIFFREKIGTWDCYGGNNVWQSRINLDYILNPDKLLDEAISWCEKNNEKIN